jgi:hypothetical protein
MKVYTPLKIDEKVKVCNIMEPDYEVFKIHPFKTGSQKPIKKRNPQHPAN